MGKSNAVILILFVVLTLAGGSLVGYVSAPGPWYQTLEKPWYNPPNWVFGPVWAVLYVMIGIAGARVFIHDRRGPLPKIWFVQIVLNYLWPLTFFTLQRPDLAIVILGGMLVSIIAFIVLGWRRERPSALMFVPYALWASFAGLLNYAILSLNPA
ncbi:TspO/MBR family protein [Hoeflea olei]|uniref:Sensor histidine kinase n=1 Tax=Hoeflea olei TaxID=1480615 RepID=A0A1C1YRN7_9HYPH|nr:TspO/MBR family protein [Hoeflea olei]OCW56096.1 sensor histidine kinase [Hoeflea olei]